MSEPGTCRTRVLTADVRMLPPHRTGLARPMVVVPPDQREAVEGPRLADRTLLQLGRGSKETGRLSCHQVRYQMGESVLKIRRFQVSLLVMRKELLLNLPSQKRRNLRLMLKECVAVLTQQKPQPVAKVPVSGAVA